MLMADGWDGCRQQKLGSGPLSSEAELINVSVNG